MPLLLLSLVVLPACFAGPSTRATDDVRVLSAVAELYHFFNNSTGLFDQTIYWQDALAVEALANVGILYPAQSEYLTAKINKTFHHTGKDLNTSNAREMNLQLSGYFDDEGWWGLAWLRAFEMTGDEAYLQRAELIFDDLKGRGWNASSCGGGVQWQYSDGVMGSGGYYKNAITNELFFAMAAKLAVVSPVQTKREAFRYDALLAWTFFNQSGIIGEHSLVNDGLCCWKYDKAIDLCCKDLVCKQHMECKAGNETTMVCGNYCTDEDVCVNNNQTTWTYNQVREIHTYIC
jgi:predicted alpha-1,6-mannanase (GH76 family)